MNTLIFWGKLARSPNAPRAWHPLICHLIDVAMVTQVMWRDVVLPAARCRCSVGLGLGEASAERWLVLIAALHDLGKLSPGFSLRDPAMAARIRAAGLSCPPGTRHTAHGAVTTLKLPGILRQEFGLDRRVASRIAVLTGGHHGVFPGDRELDGLIDADYGERDWDEARAAFVRRVVELLDVPGDARPKDLDTPTAMMLAGLISIADWIASNEAYFPYAVPDVSAPPTVDLVAYIGEAERNARQALDRLGWLGWTPPTAPLTFQALFPGKEPRPLQRQAIAVAESIAEPSLVIVEAPMGEGKTEAAMYLADWWSVVLGQRGCYFALPTQATSNQMFGRVRDFLAQRFPEELVNLQLLHGHAALSAAFQELRLTADKVFQTERIEGVFGNGPELAGVVAGEWFTHRKRSLLAPFGVGTVDQALLGVLKTPHVFVRLFGLGSKTVIVDEVHAYDTYMTTLIERLLEWLGALGTSVVLLSATLPSGRRQRLLAAYASGLGQKDATPPEKVCYPRITWATASRTGACHIGGTEGGARTVSVRWVDGALPETEGGPFRLGEELKEAVGDGGCAVVICNTVRRAQEIYRALKPCFCGIASDGLPERDLLHARFLFDERDRREKRVLLRFGKPGATVEVAEGRAETVRRPHRAVLVATQIVEQSLDLDFDLMVTELAPADLVLQRLGRLHRHERPSRPDRVSSPALWIIRPEAIGGDVPRFGAGSEAVYDPHVLLRSWLTLNDHLRDRQVISLPDDIEPLVEAVYDDRRQCPADASRALIEKWETSWKRREEEEKAEQREAIKRWLSAPSHSGDLADLTHDARAEDAPDFHQEHQALTRLAEPSVSVVFLHGTPEQPSFAPAGREPLNPSAKPTTKQAERLLRRSVTIGDRRVVFELMRRTPPDGWQRSPLLRHERLLTLDATGRAAVGNHVLCLDPDVGLVIESRKGEPA